MAKKSKNQTSGNPLFDELEFLSGEFVGVPVEEKTSSTAIDQFEKQLGDLSVRQVEIKRGNDSSDYSYFL